MSVGIEQSVWTLYIWCYSVRKPHDMPYNKKRGEKNEHIGYNKYNNNNDYNTHNEIELKLLSRIYR